MGGEGRERADQGGEGYLPTACLGRERMGVGEGGRGREL